MNLKTLLLMLFALPMMSFAQSDLQTILKGGELLLGGLSIFKVAKPDSADLQSLPTNLKNKVYQF